MRINYRGEHEMTASYVEKFCNGQLNCAQAILLEYMDKKDTEIATKMMGNFAGGLHMQGHTCGCVIGSLAALSFIALKDDITVADFIKAFEKEYGTLLCRDLLKSDLSQPPELARAKEEGLFLTLCPKLIAFCQNWIKENSL